MDNFFGRALARFAPRASRALTVLARASEEEDGLIPRSTAYDKELRALRKEIDELRQDSLRIAELYDLVFERLKIEKI